MPAGPSISTSAAFAAERAVQRRREPCALPVSLDRRAHRPIIMRCGATGAGCGGDGARGRADAGGKRQRRARRAGGGRRAREDEPAARRAGARAQPRLPAAARAWVRARVRVPVRRRAPAAGAGAPPGRAGRASALALGRRRARGGDVRADGVRGHRGRRRRRLPAPARAVLADGEPVRRRPAPDRRRRRAVGGRAVAAVPRLPRAADRGDAGRAARRHPAGQRGHPAHAHAARRRPGERGAAAPAAQRRGRRPAAGRADRRRGRRRLRARVPERDAGQPAAAERAARAR